MAFKMKLKKVIIFKRVPSKHKKINFLEGESLIFEFFV